MHFLVNHVQDHIQSELVSQLYKKEEIERLLQESEAITSRRREVTEMLQVSYELFNLLYYTFLLVMHGLFINIFEKVRLFFIQLTRPTTSTYLRIKKNIQPAVPTSTQITIGWSCPISDNGQS